MMDLDGLVRIEQFVVGQLHSAGDFALLGGQAMSGLLSSRSGHVLLTGQGPREGEPLREPVDRCTGLGEIQRLGCIPELDLDLRILQRAGLGNSCLHRLYLLASGSHLRIPIERLLDQRGQLQYDRRRIGAGGDRLSERAGEQAHQNQQPAARSSCSSHTLLLSDFCGAIATSYGSLPSGGRRLCYLCRRGISCGAKDRGRIRDEARRI